MVVTPSLRPRVRIDRPFLRRGAALLLAVGVATGCGGTAGPVSVPTAAVGSTAMAEFGGRLGEPTSTVSSLPTASGTTSSAEADPADGIAAPGPAQGPTEIGQPGAEPIPAPATPTNTEPVPEPPTPAVTRTIVYEVTGDGASTVITYTTDGAVTAQQVLGAPLPWSHTVELAADRPLALVQVSAQRSGPGEISCRITVDGVEIVRATRTGDFVLVSCARALDR